MNKQPTTLRTYLPRGAFLLSLAFVIVMPLAVGQSTPTATTCGSKIYNIGGWCSNRVCATRTTRIYDIDSDTWTTGAPIPEPGGLTDHAIAVSNGVIYIAGGTVSYCAINTVRAYDIATNTWSTLAPMPTAVFLPGFGIINGKLYVASGNECEGEVADLQIYDIATNTWSRGAPVPTPVTGPGSAVYQGKLYLFGGARALGAPFGTITTATQIYDPATNTWTSGPDMNVARLWFYGAAIGDTSIVASGGDTIPGTPINDNEQLTATWAIKAPLPYPATGPFVVSDGTFVYIGGGYDGSTGRADTLRYDPVADTYTPLAPAPNPHHLSQAVIVSIPCGTPTPTPTPGQIVLTANGHRVDQHRKLVHLRWTGANSDSVNIYRNGVRIARVQNTGSYADLLTVHGVYTYQVCEPGTMNCSNEARVRFVGP